MSYLDCRFRYGQMHVLGVYDFLPTASAITDFITGDLTLGARFSSESYDNFTEGTTLSAGAIANDTVLTVADTTGWLGNDTLAVELDIGTYHKSLITTVDSGTQVTIMTGLSSAAASTNVCVTTGQLESSVSGGIVEDFKSTKVTRIFNQSKALEITGFEHNDRNFFLGVDKVGDDNHRFQVDYNRIGVNFAISGDATGEATIDYDLVPYVFADNPDFSGFATAYRNRVLAIYGGGAGESGLVVDVTEAANTQVAMDAITDTRT